MSINPMAESARHREILHSRAIYNFHPVFANAEFVTYYGDDDLNAACLQADRSRGTFERRSHPFDAATVGAS